MSDGAGGQRPATFEESAGQVEGDYSVDVREKLLAERARELRQVRAITVDDAVLARL
jgi:hypothetical protein